MFIRPMALQDEAAVLGLAQQAGFGMTSLPPDAHVLRAKLEKAVKSFAGKPDHPGDEGYLFALVDPDTNHLVGISGIKAHIGLKQPFYSYKISKITQASEGLGIFTVHKVLGVVNDFTGCTEIGPLFLMPEYRRDGIGRFLSRVRFLFMAQFKDRFDENVISEIRGVSDHEGNSPFYDNLARPFFQMEFKRADYLNATQGNQFINDLMPKNPIYECLLPKAAQQVIGRAHPASEAAKGLLEREGFRWNEYIDIFDGGPTLEVRLGDIRTVRECSVGEVVVGQPDPDEEERYIIATCGFANFRATVGRLRVIENGKEKSRIAISPRAAKALDVAPGAAVRYIRA